MKKSAALNLLRQSTPMGATFLFRRPGPNEELIKKVNSLERGKVYLVEGAPRLKNLPVLLTHFYKTGVRFKPLCKYPPKTRRVWGSVMTVQPKPEPMTIRYSRIGLFTFKEVDASDIPLYINRASPFMEDFFKKVKHA